MYEYGKRGLDSRIIRCVPCVVPTALFAVAIQELVFKLKFSRKLIATETAQTQQQVNTKEI